MVKITGKKKRVKATARQHAAFAALVEKGGKTPISKVMREAGYSEAMVKNPDRLLDSDGFKALMEEYLPDDLLAKIHREGLEAFNKVSLRIGTDEKGHPTFKVAPVPDFGTRHQYLKTAYEIKGRLKQNNVVVATQVNVSEDRSKYA